MKKLLVTALLLAASLLVVGTTLTANATSKTTPCKTVKYNETKLVWNAKHTKKITVVVTKLVKETIRVHGKLKTSYVEVPVVKSVKICTAAKKATAPTTTTVPVPTTITPTTAAPAPQPPTVVYVPAPTPITTAPVPTTVAPPTTTTTTTTTTVPLPPPAGMTISTIFVNPQGVVQVTGTFVGVTALTFCTDPIQPPTSFTDPIPTPPNSPLLAAACTPTVSQPSVGDFCSAAIISSSGVQSAECTLPGYLGYLGHNELDLTGVPDTSIAGCSGACLTVASIAGGASFYLQENEYSLPATMKYWEYPVPVVPNQPLATDGPVGGITVVPDPSDLSKSIVTITGTVVDYPDVAGSEVSVVTNEPSISFPDTPPAVAPIGNPNPDPIAAVVSITVDEPIPYLQANGFQIGWSGGTNYDTEYSFASLVYGSWNTNEIVDYDSTSSTWYIATAPTLYVP